MNYFKYWTLQFFVSYIHAHVFSLVNPSQYVQAAHIFFIQVIEFTGLYAYIPLESLKESDLICY